jgi:hypothetical protein
LSQIRRGCFVHGLLCSKDRFVPGTFRYKIYGTFRQGTKNISGAESHNIDDALHGLGIGKFKNLHFDADPTKENYALPWRLWSSGSAIQEIGAPNADRGSGVSVNPLLHIVRFVMYFKLLCNSENVEHLHIPVEFL